MLFWRLVAGPGSETARQSSKSARMFTLNNKIAMAVAMPFVVASIVGGILVSTHRTAFPSLVPRPGLMPMSPPMQRATTCMNEDIPFSGIAISSKMVEHVTSFQRITQSHINIVEFYNPFPGSFDRWNALNAIQLHALPLI